MFRAISAFDLDHTLLSANSSYCFGRYLCAKKHLPPQTLFFIISCHFRYSLGLLPIVALHQKAFQRLFFGRSISQVNEWVNEFLDAHLARLLYRPAVEQLQQAQQDGHLTVILSSSPEILVKPIAARLNVPVWHATQYAVDKEHRFCHILRLMLGDDKARILQEMRQEQGVAVQDVYAYSDSHLDLPFLQAAGHPIGVKPNRQLRAICRKNRWSIL